MMLHTSCNTHTMLYYVVQQCTHMLEQQTIMWRWFCIDVAWCILMCNIMFICYNNVSMYLMILQWYKHCYNVVQQSTIMFTNDNQCCIMFQHSDSAVTMMRNLLLRCYNIVTMYTNAHTCLPMLNYVPTHVHDVTMTCTNVECYVTSMLRYTSMLQHSCDDVEHVLLCRNNVVTVYYNLTLQLHKRTMLH